MATKPLAAGGSALSSNDKSDVREQIGAVTDTFGLKSYSELVIVGFGDSHTNGVIPTVSATAGPIGVTALVSPLDFGWNGTVRTPLLANAVINVSTGNADPMLGWNNTVGSYLAYLPLLIRSAYPGLQRITVVNAGVGGVCAYNFSGEQSGAYVYAAANANADDTITVDGQVYTFKASASAAYEVTIGGTAALTATNLLRAINLESTGWGAGTVQHPTVFAPSQTGSTYNLLRSRRTGTAGNTIQISSSNNVRFTTMNMAQVVTNPATMSGGSATAVAYNNMKTALTGIGIGSAGVGTVFVGTFGSNDNGRLGYRGQYFDEELQKIVGNISADYPTAKITLATVPNATICNPKAVTVAAANPTKLALADFAAIALGTGTDVRLMATDGLHYSHYGYTLLAQLQARAACTLLLA